MGDPRQQALHRLELAEQLLDLVKRIAVVLQWDEVHLAVLADADAGLRRFDATAADALPGWNRIVHLH